MPQYPLHGGVSTQLGKKRTAKPRQPKLQNHAKDTRYEHSLGKVCSLKVDYAHTRSNDQKNHLLGDEPLAVFPARRGGVERVVELEVRVLCRLTA